MKKRTIYARVFREDETIEVQCLFLQNEFKSALKNERELNQYKDTIKKLLAKIDGLEARYELITLLNSKTNLKTRRKGII